MSKFGLSVVAAGLIGSAMLLSGTAPAAATTLSGSAFAEPVTMTMIEQVQRRGDDRVRRGDRVRRHDSRRHRSNRYSRRGFRHHRGGRHDSDHHFGSAAIGFGLGIIAPYVLSPALSPGHSGHVQWCHNRFRSYSAATDSYLGYDGSYHRCISPY